MRPTRRTFLTGLSAAAVASALTACGDDTTSLGADDNPAASEVPVEENVFPATIAHKYGETTIEKAPQRVVVIGLVDQDAVLALGIVPVGVTYWYGDEALGGINPWADAALGDATKPTLLKDTDGVDTEAVLKLQPDLIIGQYAGTTEREYELLSKIAPTVVQPGEYADFGVPWEEATVTIGTALGKPAAAQKLVDDVAARIDEEAAAHPEFAGQTAVVVTPYEGLFVYGAEDPRARILAGLGFGFPEVFTGVGDEFGVSLSSERTTDLDEVDVAVFLGLDADPAVKKVFETTDTFADGRWVDIDDTVTPDYAVGHSFVTVLSIPYVLDRYVPQLAAAADGDPATEVPAGTD